MVRCMLGYYEQTPFSGQINSGRIRVNMEGVPCLG